MSVGAREPVPLFGRVSTWGLSRHGLVRNGILTLANGDPMPWVQPMPVTPPGEWTSGDVLYIKRPGWTGPELSQEQINADAAAGREFRSYALISGGTRWLGNEWLEGAWIWFDADGNAWRVWVSGISGTAAACEMTFKLRRFGLFDGGTHADVQRVAPVFNQGIDTGPAIKVRSVPNGALVDMDTTTRRAPYLVSVTPGGDRALFAIFERHYPGGYASGLGGAYLDRAIAFLEAVIQPNAAVTVTCIRTLSQCIGAVSASAPAGRPTPGDWDTKVVHYRDRVETVTGTCSGGANTHEIVDTATSDVVAFSDPAPGMTVAEFAVGSAGVWTAEVGEIAAMWYDVDGMLHEVRVLRTYRFTSGGSVSPAASGIDHQYQVCDTFGNPVWEPKTWGTAWSHSQSYSAELVQSITILDNGVEIAGAGTTLVANYSGTLSYSRTTLSSGDATQEYAASASMSMSIDGVQIGSWSGSADLPTDVPELPDGAPDLWSGFYAGVRTLDMISFGLFSSAVIATYGQPAVGVSVEPCRWSSQVIGAHAQIAPAHEQFSPIFSEHRFGNVATPAGMVGHDESFSTPGRTARVTVSGTFQPVTQMFVSSISEDGGDDPHERVCWV